MCFAWQAQGFRDVARYTWQAQEFVRVAKTLAGVVDLKRVRNDAFRVASAGISGFAKSMLEASGAVTGVRMPRLNFLVAGAILLKHPRKNR